MAGNETPTKQSAEAALEIFNRYHNGGLISHDEGDLMRKTIRTALRSFIDARGVDIDYESPVKCDYCKRVNARVCYKFHHEPPYKKPAAPAAQPEQVNKELLEALRLADTIIPPENKVWETTYGKALEAIANARGVEGERYRIEHDGFQGTVIGHYKRLDGYEGVVMQQEGTKVVHVYGKKWLLAAAPAPPHTPDDEAFSPTHPPIINNSVNNDEARRRDWKGPFICGHGEEVAPNVYKTLQVCPEFGSDRIDTYVLKDPAKERESIVKDFPEEIYVYGHIDENGKSTLKVDNEPFPTHTVYIKKDLTGKKNPK